MSLNIYVHGNCQATAIASLLQEVLEDKASIEAREVFSVNLDQGDDITSLVENADVIISQPIGAGYRGVEFLSTAWIGAHVKAGGCLLKVPVIYDRTHLPQCFPLAGLHDGRLAYHDAHALDYFLCGLSADEFLRDTGRSDFLSDSFVLSEAIRSLNEILRREHDANVDIRVSDSLVEALAVRQPMSSVNHPDRGLLVEVANRLLTKMGRSERVAVDGEPLLDHFVIPPYLSTVLALGHTGTGMDFERVRHDARWEDRHDYFKEVFSTYEVIGQERLGEACASQHELGAYLARRRHSVGAGFQDSRALVEGMYRGFFGRNPDTSEVLHHLKVLKQAGFEVLLSQFLALSKANGG